MKEPATIRSVNPGYYEEHFDGDTFWVYFDYETGGTQGFGGYKLDKDLCHKVMFEICDVFEVTDVRQLVGKKCNVLRHFSEWNAAIDGIEVPETGKIWLMAKFLERNGFKTKDAFDKKVASIKSNIEHLKLQVAEQEEILKTIASRYETWEENLKGVKK